MTGFSDTLQAEVRKRFSLIDTCLEQGGRVFFENAGGALSLKSVVETSRKYASIPDNQGRANPSSQEAVRVIAQAKKDMADFMNAPEGKFFVGESGTELLFRIIMNVCLAVGQGVVLGSTLEHPATRSACDRWARISGMQHVLIPHDDKKGTITPEAYAKAVTPETKLATILHTSPVTGIGVDIVGVSKAIRRISPECYIIVDGIQHAAHGQIDLKQYDIDGYVVSPYKVFSRHGYGLAWISKRIVGLPHDCLLEGPEGNWELGTRDAGSYATFSDVVDYFAWLGGMVAPEAESRHEKFVAAGQAIRAQEFSLCQAMLFGVNNLQGLSEISGVQIIGGVSNPAREGLVSFCIDGIPSIDIVKILNDQGIRTHLRKADQYSGSTLRPLGWDSCVRVSMCHYNSLAEVAHFLGAMKQIKSL